MTKKKAKSIGMLDIKNPTPRQLAFFASMILMLIVLLLFLITNLFSLQPTSINTIVIVTTTVFIAGYFIFVSALKRYIYRKVKLIYKTIHRFKRYKGDLSMKIDLNNHIIDEVEQEVISWAKDNKKEIDNLKRNEDYRKKLLGTISHELKTPIFNIQGYLYTLMDGGIDDVTIRDKYLERAANNVERLNTIVQDLIAISQFESGDLKVEPQKFDINELTKEIYDDLSIKAEQKGIKLKIKEGCDRPFSVNADKDRIRQVLTNLISNSIKYGKTNGETKVSYYNMDKNILIEVSDDGIGVKAEHIPHLFERFYRVDKSRSRDEGGTGLGLSIVKHIIEAHNQTINVRSREGVGSTFGFTLENASLQ